LPGSFFSLEKLGQALAEKYGDQTARGLMIRIGRASLTFVRRYYPVVSELGNIENRIKPLDVRFPYSLDVLAGMISQNVGIEVKSAPAGKLAFEWKINATDRQLYAPYYHFGLLEEFCYWLDTRKYYQLTYADGNSEPGMQVIGLQVKDME
jgi:hypothetical protein